MSILFVLVWALAASRAPALRPGNYNPESVIGPLAEEPQVCFLQKDDKFDGLGHQMFSMLTVMGAHGVVGESGMCHVYNALPRRFMFDHLEEGSEPLKEATALMTGFYLDFVSKVGPMGCATAELMAKAPKTFQPVGRYLLLLSDVCKTDTTTWGLDNLYYGSDMNAFNHRQLTSKPPPFMQAVIKNASQLAVLATAHLPRVEKSVPFLAVHMRFGDRETSELPIAEGQRTLFRSSEVLSRLSSARVFSDTLGQAKLYLVGTAAAGAEFCGEECATAVQAIATMVAADVFVGSFSDMSSMAAIMRIGLGKTHTYMPSCWQWAHGYSEPELSLYDVADHHQKACHEQCAPDLDWCHWCGRHRAGSGDLQQMLCCEEGRSYPPEHRCHGAIFDPELAGQRQCVTKAVQPNSEEAA